MSVVTTSGGAPFASPKGSAQTRTQHMGSSADRLVFLYRLTAGRVVITSTALDACTLRNFEILA